MSEKILDALKKLDTQNDNHWTSDKLPRVETVRLLAADQTLTRDEIEAAAAGFTRDTATAYWLSTPAAATGPAGADDGAAQGVSGSPHPQGAGAAPQAETQKVEGAETAGTSGDGTDPAGTPEQPPLEDDGPTDEQNELAALEAELEDTKAAIDEYRAVIDEANDKLKALYIVEQDLTNKVNAATPSGNKNADAIQAYFAQQQRNLQDRAARKAMIKESGIDLAELARGLKSPLDNAMSRKTGRGGQRPTR
jgi:hypothetical protein